MTPTPDDAIPEDVMELAREVAAKDWETRGDGVLFAERTRAGLRDGAWEVEVAAAAILADRRNRPAVAGEVAEQLRIWIWEQMEKHGDDLVAMRPAFDLILNKIDELRSAIPSGQECPDCAGTGYKDKGGARLAIQRTRCDRCTPSGQEMEPAAPVRVTGAIETMANFEGWWEDTVHPETPNYIRQYCLSAWRTALASAEPEGWKLVPVEPTREMLKAMVRRRGLDPDATALDVLDHLTVSVLADSVADYRAMFAAVPVHAEEVKP